MSFFICLSCSKPKIPEAELFNEPFTLLNMSETPVGKITSRGITDDVPFMVIYSCDSHSLINRAGKELKHAGQFIKCLKRACQHSKSVSLLLFFARGNIYTEKVKVKEQRKITLESFTEAFPDIDENILYIVYQDYSRIHLFENNNAPY